MPFVWRFLLKKAQFFFSLNIKEIQENLQQKLNNLSPRSEMNLQFAYICINIYKQHTFWTLKRFFGLKDENNHKKKIMWLFWNKKQNNRNSKDQIP